MTSKIDRKDVERLFFGLPSAHIVVIGDLMLDEYIHGDVTRISPEAPVPIVEQRAREFRAGGAANTAANIAALGARVSLVGVVGIDSAGDDLRALLTGIDVAHVLADDGRPTTRKTRILARGQQVVRVDHESRAALSVALEQRLIAHIETLIADADACVLSDYSKGTLTRHLVRAAIAAAQGRGCPVVVDPKTRDLSLYRGATVITPNLKELEAATGVHAETDADVVAAGSSVLDAVTPASLLVTRGAAGMTLLQAGRPPLHVPTAAKVVFDVTGAGDTVVSVMAAGLARGMPLGQLVPLANLAAGVVVSKVGTTAITAHELLSTLSPQE